ncbi:MAG: fumarate hydratase, class II [Flavobacteriales bacterium]|nr:fumarate hydratase, class II [Flavobacteriales bacterium]|tara:strand:+ start:3742 stop:5115 length:1374 start_codon:yes stop_codon:yes gene_type:complete
MREEFDSLGKVLVDDDKLWGAQTERSRQNFKIGPQSSMPIEIIYAFALLKKSIAHANCDLGILSEEKKNLISLVCDEIIAGKLDSHFPLVIWQTGSGTQTNMNLNEVIVNRAKYYSDKVLLHPNDDVNKSQSSNDTFPTVLHIAAYKIIINHTIPKIEKLLDSLNLKSKEFSDLIKIGRTHFMDATPITFGQEFSGYHRQLEMGLNQLKKDLKNISELPIGGTAVGTGLNTLNGYDKLVVQKINTFTNFDFCVAKNKFQALSSSESIVSVHHALKQISQSLTKIANDIRVSSSGPRSGIGELILPKNEPGSSIMPGKVNPTQCEAITMVCAQVIGNDSAISYGASQGHFQLNVFRPMIAFNFLFSAEIIGDACFSFSKNCVEGIIVNIEKSKHNLNNSLMLVTALNKHIGYDRAATIANLAYDKGITLKEAAVSLNILKEEEFDDLVNPANMIGPKN